MRIRSAFIALQRASIPTPARLVACLILSVAVNGASARTAPPATTRAQAIAIVRSIINRNTQSCRITKTNSITATASGRNWRVTARIVMSASGSPVNETAVWTVRSDGEAVPADQLTAEISDGCP